MGRYFGDCADKPRRGLTIPRADRGKQHLVVRVVLAVEFPNSQAFGAPRKDTSTGRTILHVVFFEVRSTLASMRHEHIPRLPKATGAAASAVAVTREPRLGTAAAERLGKGAVIG